MKTRLMFLTTLCAGMLAGCGGGESATTAGTPQSTAPAEAAGAAAVAATLPEGLILAAAPGDVIPVAEARRTAKAGDTVSLAGYIGGRAEPFTEGRAVFLLADSEAAPACTDACAVPWDACCTPRETITANSATVQVVDAGGMPLKVGLEGRDGLKPGATVTVVGKVREAGDAVMIVDATGLWVASAQ